MMKITRLPWCLVLLVVIAGCGDNRSAVTPTLDAPPFLDVAMSQDEIDALKPGDPAFAMVEREDGIHFEPIVLGRQYDDGNQHFLLFKDPQLRFGIGDSGSPILGQNGKTIGALSGSLGGDSVTITLITNMLAAMDPGQRTTTGFRDDLAWYAIGLSKIQRQRLRDAGIPVNDFDVEPLMSSPLTKGDSRRSVAAGRSMAVVMFEGPLASVYMAGTVTHAIDENEMIAFGHSIWWWGALDRALAAKPALVVQFVNDPPMENAKLALPVGEVEGGITQDRYYGILFDRNADVDGVDIVVNANGDTTTHRIYHLDSIDHESSVFLVGLDSIVHKMFDGSQPGSFPTNVTITWGDESTSTVELGGVDWAGGALSVWYGIDGAADFYNMKRLEVTLEMKTGQPPLQNR